MEKAFFAVVLINITHTTLMKWLPDSDPATGGVTFTSNRVARWKLAAPLDQVKALGKLLED
jgi:hypothetical protein